MGTTIREQEYVNIVCKKAHRSCQTLVFIIGHLKKRDEVRATFGLQKLAVSLENITYPVPKPKSGGPH
jgi:hypothetical protein